MFYRIALSDSAPYNVAHSPDGGETFYIPGEIHPYRRDELSEGIDLPIPHVVYQDGTHARIGDAVVSIDGSVRGVVVELHHPKGIFTSGRVKLGTGELISAGGINRE